MILGDFNDGKDGQNASHCVLTPDAEQRVRRLRRALQEAQGGRADRPHLRRQPHLGQRRGRHSTQANKITDHPLVVATTAGSSAGCAVDRHRDRATTSARSSRSWPSWSTSSAPMFDIKTVGGYRESATDPNGHPAGLAADFMVPLSAAGKARATALAAYARAHASELGIDYIIW